MARADKPLLHTLETRGLLHTPCRALSRGYKRLRIGGLVVPGKHLLHTPCNGVCRVCGPRPCYKPLVLTRSHMIIRSPYTLYSIYLRGTTVVAPFWGTHPAPYIPKLSEDLRASRSPRHTWQEHSTKDAPRRRRR